MTADRVLVETAQALARGEPTRAIDLAEQLADEGTRHPDVSYNRGLAYVARARGGAAKPGDLGRAAAAFEEALLLRPGDDEAHAALDAVRLRVAERRVKEGGSPDVSVDDTPVRELVRRAPADLFPALAVLFGAVFAVTFILRHKRAALPAVAVVAGVLWAGAAGLSWVSRDVAKAIAVGVVVVDEARWVDEKGAPLPTSGVPESARVDVLADEGAVVRVRVGKSEGRIRRDGLVVLPRE